MRLSRLHVRNFRSIVDSGEFDVQPLFGIVGENNCGKSNLLRAVDILVSAGSGRLGKGEFNEPALPVVIKGTFDDLTDGEKKRWRPYLVQGHLILEKHVSATTDERTGKDKVAGEFHGYQAEPEAVHLSLPKIAATYGERPKWADIVVEAGLPDYFLQDGKCTKAIFTKGLERFLAENDVEYDAPDLSATQALGLQSNVVAHLPKVHLLPAITDYSDEIDKRSSTSTFRRLMGDLSGRLLQRDSRYLELQRALDTIRGLLNRTEDADAPARIDALSVVERKIAEILQRVMPSVREVALAVEVQDLSELFSAGVSLAVDDGIQTDVLAKGHGLQRCVVFALLQTLILNERDQLVAEDAGEAQSDSPIILLIEEPELYIHPQLGKLLFDVLRDFSESDQVIYSTHSPLFVDAYESEQVAIVTKASVADGTKVKTCDSSAFVGLTERKVFQGLTRLNPAINELFFARQVMLVEGQEDLIAVTAALKKAGRIDRRVEEIEWSVIVCGGKQSIPFFQRVLNAFGIPYGVLHDLDMEDTMSEDKKRSAAEENMRIAALAGPRRVSTYPVKLEASLGLTEHFRDQYDAHRFFLDTDNITPEVQTIIEGAFS